MNTGSYSGIMVFLDRSAPANTGISVGGNTNLIMSGVLYMPTGKITMQGGPSIASPSQIIVNSIDLGGNPDLNINYDGRNPVTINNVWLEQ
jgi:hypothetical protein